MRKILRAAAKTLTVFLWVTKGLLLLIAVGVMVLWPMSRERTTWVIAQRFSAQPQQADYHWVGAACNNGLIIVYDGLRRSSAGAMFTSIQDEVARSGQEWRLLHGSQPYKYDGTAFSYSSGPFRWNWEDSIQQDGTYSDRAVASPCWLVAPALALWPLTSLTLVIRRRRRQRRRELVGCCQKCGYDLRTTEKGGPLLARCPECGAPTAKNLLPQMKTDEHR